MNAYFQMSFFFGVANLVMVMRILGICVIDIQKTTAVELLGIEITDKCTQFGENVNGPWTLGIQIMLNLMYEPYNCTSG